MEVELILLYCFSNKVIVLRTSFTVTKGLETSEVFGGIVI